MPAIGLVYLTGPGKDNLFGNTQGSPCIGMIGLQTSQTMDTAKAARIVLNFSCRTELGAYHLEPGAGTIKIVIPGVHGVKIGLRMPCVKQTKIFFNYHIFLFNCDHCD